MKLVQSIELNNYSSAYRLAEVSLHEDLTVVVGPNGAGKSTFLEGAARFGTTGEIDEDTLSNYDPNLVSRYPSEIPIATLTFDLADGNESLLKPLIGQPDIQSLAIVDNTLRTESGGKIELNQCLPNSGEMLTVTRYANGSHKLHTANGRYNVNTLIKKRVQDLHQISVELIEQAVSMGLLDSSVEKSELDTSTLSDKVNTLEEQVDFDDYNDETGLSLDTEIYNDLDKVTTYLINLFQLRSDILGSLPNIEYFDRIRAIPNEVSIADLKSQTQYQGLLTWGGISPERASSVNKEVLQQALDSGAEELTTYLNYYIELENNASNGVLSAVSDPSKGRYEVRCSIDDGAVHLYIKDEKEGTSIPINKKSTGFQWLVSCLLTIFSGVIDPMQTDMFLIDDLGVHLHPDWKIRLRKALHAIASDSQIIYSTHSPFFIENGSLDQVRVASIEPQGTRLQTVSEAQGSIHVHDKLEPLRSSLGAHVAEFLFGANGIVITEGTTDIDYIECFSELFEQNGSLPTLNEDIAIMNGKGTNQIVLANFLETEQDNYYCLMDKDDSGDTQFDKFRESDIEATKFDQLDILPNQKANHHTEIEDLFPDALICELVAKELQPVVTKRDLLDRVISDPDKGILESIEGRLKQYKGEGDLSYVPDIPKEAVCDAMTESVDDSWITNGGKKGDTIEDFVKLIDTINSKLT